MAVTANLHIIGSGQATKRKGRIEEIQVSAIVYDITPGADWYAQAIAACPPSGDPHPVETSLFLEDITPRLIRAPDIVEVELVYRRKEEANPTEDAGDDPMGALARFIVRGGSTVNQIETQKKTDGTTINVTYNGKTQTGTISVTQRQDTIVFEMEMVESYPGNVSRAYSNKVNATEWQNDDPGTWMCTNVDFDPSDRSTSSWKFQFTFQFNEDGWQPVVAWKSADGIIPADVNLGTENGLKKIVYYGTAEFNAIFPTS